MTSREGVDRDGDGISDDSLPPRPEFELIAGRSELSVAELISAELPDSHPMSPMGQIDAMGNFLQQGLRRGGWRRKVVKLYAWFPVILFAVLALIGWLF